MLVYEFNPIKQNCMELVRVSLGVILGTIKGTSIKNHFSRTSPYFHILVHIINLNGCGCHIQHAFRERNSAADMLVFIGMSETLGLHIWDSTPAAVRQLMYNDLCRVCTLKYVAV